MTVKLHLNQSVPSDVRGGPKIERWAAGWLIGFRRHFVIFTGGNVSGLKVRQVACAETRAREPGPCWMRRPWLRRWAWYWAVRYAFIWRSGRLLLALAIRGVPWIGSRLAWRIHRGAILNPAPVAPYVLHYFEELSEREGGQPRASDAGLDYREADRREVAGAGNEPGAPSRSESSSFAIAFHILWRTEEKLQQLAMRLRP